MIQQVRMKLYHFRRYLLRDSEHLKEATASEVMHMFIIFSYFYVYYKTLFKINVSTLFTSNIQPILDTSSPLKILGGSFTMIELLSLSLYIFFFLMGMHLTRIFFYIEELDDNEELRKKLIKNKKHAFIFDFLLRMTILILIYLFLVKTVYSLGFSEDNNIFFNSIPLFISIYIALLLWDIFVSSELKRFIPSTLIGLAIWVFTFISYEKGALHISYIIFISVLCLVYAFDLWRRNTHLYLGKYIKEFLQKILLVFCRNTKEFTC